MTRSRGRREPEFRGDFGDQDITQALAAVRPDDDSTVIFTGMSVIGLPDDVTLVGVDRRQGGGAPLASYRPAPASFPMLPAAPRPQPPVLAPVPVTEPAVIGDQLRVPFLWCEMPGCITWCTDTAASGERDMRDRAIAHGWRADGFGRLACPPCQQADPGFRATQPVVRAHPGIRRRKLAGIPVTPEAERRLAAQAECYRRLRVEDPALARDVADASDRHEQQERAS